jgi:hypothetical protein
MNEAETRAEHIDPTLKAADELGRQQPETLTIEPKSGRHLSMLGPPGA